MALPLGKITIIIGAGIVGSILTKEGRFSNVSDFFSGAFKIVKKHLQEDKSSSSSAGKPQNDFLISQVNNLRQQLQMLQSSGSVTIITRSRSGSGPYSVTAIVIVGAAGYGYIWWKGWKLSDVMFVTRRGLSDACNTVAKQLELVSSSISSAKKHLSSRIDRVDCSIEDCMELTTATKVEVSKLHGDLSGFHVEVESVHRAVQTLETKLGQIEGSQDITTKGLYHLCGLAKMLEQSKKPEHIQAIQSSTSLPALELPETMSVTRTGSLPPRISAIEPSSPSPTESPKVLLQSKAVSASGLKELQGISSVVKSGNFRSSSAKAFRPEASNGSAVSEEPSNSNPSPSSGMFGWKLPNLGLLRTRSAADTYR